MNNNIAAEKTNSTKDEQLDNGSETLTPTTLKSSSRSKSVKSAKLEEPRLNGSASHNGDDFSRKLLGVLSSLRDGDFSVRMPTDLTGLDGKVADTLNDLASEMDRSRASLLRLRNEVGRKGRIGERLLLEKAVGGWAERVEAVNS